MENNFNFSAEAVKAIESLRHFAGTFDYYIKTINRLFAYVLHCSDEIGMDALETVSTLRALDALRSDIKSIAEIDKSDDKTSDDVQDVEDMPINDNPHPYAFNSYLIQANISAIDARREINEAIDIVENCTEVIPASTKIAIAAADKLNEAINLIESILN